MMDRRLLVVAGLILAVGILGACEDPRGTLRVSTMTDGETLDSDGYTLVVAEMDTTSDRAGARDTQAVRSADTVSFGGLSPGDYELTLSDVQPNCTTEHPRSRRFGVSPGDTATVKISVTCEAALFNHIVFTSTRSEDPEPYDSNTEIYAIRPDGSGLTRLTHNVEGHTTDYDREPVVAPRGRVIAFVSRRDNNREIYSMAPDGSDVTRLTHNDWGSATRALDVHPAFSPDGSTIVYESHRRVEHEGPVSGSQSDLYTVTPDGDEQMQLTSGESYEQSPTYGPDGKTIAYLEYQGERDGTRDLFLMNADGSNSRRLTDNAASDGEQVFSPSGEQIVFVSDRDGNSEIYKMTVDGSEVTRLTNNDSPDSTPTYCAEDGPIVFVSEQDGNEELYAMRPDGSGLTRLTEHDAANDAPVCSPDGDRVAFVSDRDGNDEIYVVDTDGEGLRRVTDHPSTDQSPVWSPVR